MSKATWTKKCTCGKEAGRNLTREAGNVDSQMIEYSFDGDGGTRMYAAAYLPSQAKEARERHPGTEFRMRNGCLLPVIKNRRHKLKFLKERGFVELD